MRKANDSQLHLLEHTGMYIEQYESAYFKEQMGLIGLEWDPIVITKKGKVKMISIQRIVKDENTKDRVWELSQGRKVPIEKKRAFRRRCRPGCDDHSFLCRPGKFFSVR